MSVFQEPCKGYAIGISQLKNHTKAEVKRNEQRNE
jgi:hypothetical protein